MEHHQPEQCGPDPSRENAEHFQNLSQNQNPVVISAKAGIQGPFGNREGPWIPTFAGMTI
jgi:hypothetical protein